MSLRVGVAHHYGWAVAVTADSQHEVVDRRRIELLDSADLPGAPIHHEGGAHAMHGVGLPDEALAALVAEVRASCVRAAAIALASLPDGVMSISVRDWPSDMPTDIAVLRRPPWESKVDSFMYCQVLAEVAAGRGWSVHRYDAKTVEVDAARLLGARAEAVLHGPRRRLGAPWGKDQRVALAATVVASSG